MRASLTRSSAKDEYEHVFDKYLLYYCILRFIDISISVAIAENDKKYAKNSKFNPTSPSAVTAPIIIDTQDIHDNIS